MGEIAKRKGIASMGCSKVGGVGAQLLAKMGWKEGTGLGARKDGLKEPVRHRRRQAKEEGLGRKNSTMDDNWWMKLMENAYGSPKDGEAVDLFEACEGRRCRPHGTAKLARIEAHDRAAQRTGNCSDTKVVAVSASVQETSESLNGRNEASLMSTKTEKTIPDGESENVQNKVVVCKVKGSSEHHVNGTKTRNLKERAKLDRCVKSLRTIEDDGAVGSNPGSRISLKVGATILKKRKRRQKEKS